MENYASQPTQVFFVDKFRIPISVVDEFIDRTEYNRTFIKTLPGFIGDLMIVRNDSDENLILMTVATWASAEYLAAARLKVQEEYKRINFNPAEFMKKLNVTMERELYHAYSPRP